MIETDSTLVFWCAPCARIFNNDHGNNPESLDDVAICPQCKNKRGAVEFQSWMTGLTRARQSPWTDERRQKAAIAGAKGPHPGPTTELGRARSSANALQHGAFAHRFILPIARAGKYASCEDCPFAPAADAEHVNENGDNACAQNRFLHCVHNLELYGRVLNAHLNKNPDELRKIFANIQASNLVTLLDAYRRVAMEGPTIIRKIKRPDKDGNPVECGEIEEPHPALIAIEKLGKLAGADLPQWELTPKTHTEQVNANNMASAIEEFMFKMAGNPDKAGENPE